MQSKLKKHSEYFHEAIIAAAIEASSPDPPWNVKGIVWRRGGLLRIARFSRHYSCWICE
jgi:hypothetical protein